MPRGPDLAKRQVWRRRLLEFERGNTTIAEFCRRAGVAVWSFYHWRRELERRTARVPRRKSNEDASVSRNTRSLDRSRRAETKPGVKFAPIEIMGRLGVEVHLPNGARVTVPGHVREAIRAVSATVRVRRAPTLLFWLLRIGFMFRRDA